MAKSADVPWYKVPWYENVVEAISLQAYYAGWAGSTHADPNDREGSYELDYQPLEKRIARALVNSGVPTEAMNLWDGWVTNRTREVAIENRHATPSAMIALHRLLARKYLDWRIDVTLVGAIRRLDVRGQISLRKDWVLCFGTGRKLIDKVRKTLS